MKTKLIRMRGIPALALVGALAVVGVGYAAIPGPDGVIHSCYNASSNPSGQLRVIDADGGQKCANLDFRCVHSTLLSGRRVRRAGSCS